MASNISFKDLYKNEPLGVRYYLLKKYYQDNKLDFNQKIAITKEWDSILDIIVNRNNNGKEYEKTNLNKAIRLYEMNVTDGADTPHPYDRLRVIYKKQKRYDDAIRVCQVYINISKRISQIKSGSQDLSYLEEYIQWIGKLEVEKAKV